MHSTISTSQLSRRTILIAGSSLTLSALLPSFALGLSEDIAVRFIKDVVADVQQAISSGKTEAQMLIDFEKIFRSYGEVPLIAKAALGAPGRTASSAQLSAYIAAFQGYISRKYGRQFRNFADDTIVVTGSRDAGTKGVLVQCRVDQKSKPSYDLEWWVIEISGRPKIFDIKIEGISMISTERTEVGAILESFNGDIGKMTVYLREQ